MITSVSRQRSGSISGNPSSSTSPGSTATPSARPPRPHSKVSHAAIMHNKRLRGYYGSSPLAPIGATQMFGRYDSFRTTQPSDDGAAVESTPRTSHTPKKSCIEIVTPTKTVGVRIGPGMKMKTIRTDHPIALTNKMNSFPHSVTTSTLSNTEFISTARPTTGPPKVPSNHGGVQMRAGKKTLQLRENEEALQCGPLSVVVMPNVSAASLSHFS